MEHAHPLTIRGIRRLPFCQQYLELLHYPIIELIQPCDKHDCKPREQRPRMMPSDLYLRDVCKSWRNIQMFYIRNLYQNEIVQIPGNNLHWHYCPTTLRHQVQLRVFVSCLVSSVRMLYNFLSQGDIQRQFLQDVLVQYQ